MNRMNRINRRAHLMTVPGTDSQYSVRPLSPLEADFEQSDDSAGTDCEKAIEVESNYDGTIASFWNMPYWEMPHQLADEEETTKFLPSEEHVADKVESCGGQAAVWCWKNRRGTTSTAAAPGRSSISLPRFSGVMFHVVAFFTVNVILIWVYIFFLNSNDPSTTTKQTISTTAIVLEAGGTTTNSSGTNTTTGYVPYDKIFGHVHIAKTAGTEINGELAAHFERVCGHKGYSYDAYSYNKRVRASELKNPIHAGGEDIISYKYPKFNRGRVQSDVMREIGFEDCDYVSLEQASPTWLRISEMWPLELHVPCRNPLDHFMSQCNHYHHTFDCNVDGPRLMQEIDICLKHLNRFSKELLNVSSISVKCFNPIPMEPYLEYMSQYLQHKRIEAEYIHRDTNVPRDKSKECLWTNQKAADRVLKVLLAHDYYSFCDECMGSSDDLLLRFGG